MSDIVLSVEVRERTGTGGARETRRNGFVPGVLYGGDKGPVSIALKNNEVIKAINSGKFLAQMITIDHKGEKQSVLTRDVQFHPVRDEPVHIDFQRVDESTIITVEVTVHFHNDEKSPGLKRGGVLNVVRHAVEVNVPAGSIPDQIDVDLSGYDIGDSIHISAVTLPEGVTPAITDRDFTIATIQNSRAARATEDEEGAEGEETEAEGDEE
ncbi:MAG: 50S ribosomal protein L25 [Oceanicaulis sp.]|jgi:large subunit ribosomal protein L25|uniref:50S ribosomal protein L25/general stress protein Ctc n=1 Tax=unclassified Oceanicaulis TaxID=2632123 RepID=UPI0000668C6D|nr:MULTISPECIES: 50S ribosomal protein L25/general stress protein Ctc [unclassified Oceanicaulis]EAP90704.1 ribosomal 5S rRNA E-loop binding protein [Oceanicaulis alexandrii HTCC2633] [Oceanicaulis sp. HTCC2633]MAB70111.1 50S ribosomal protein L25 [Oceanicaulis sp.]MBC40121.1 50S ribosomal protein L25 [Oceanicaulis sp.]MBG36994.1 50S ribosomal protein L25 [Oceanicaulis sp.]HBU60903.1 50S ribosomal protein L25 [Oceanicaulis sp.]